MMNVGLAVLATGVFVAKIPGMVACMLGRHDFHDTRTVTTGWMETYRLERCSRCPAKGIGDVVREEWGDRRLTDSQLTVMAETLIGSCVTIETGLEAALGRDEVDAMHDMTMADCRRFDTLAFLCEECGWWFSIEDLGESEPDLRCEECIEHEREWSA